MIESLLVRSSENIFLHLQKTSPHSTDSSKYKQLLISEHHHPIPLSCPLSLLFNRESVAASHYIPSSVLSFHLTPVCKLSQNSGMTPKPPSPVGHRTTSFPTPEAHPLGSSHSFVLSSTHQSGLQACSWPRAAPSPLTSFSYPHCWAAASLLTSLR